jgi:hypothetical protein
MLVTREFQKFSIECMYFSDFIALLWCLLSQCLIKPPAKESTRPIDLKLHSDMRAVERAEFDHQVLF